MAEGIESYQKVRWPGDEESMEEYNLKEKWIRFITCLLRKVDADWLIDTLEHRKKGSSREITEEFEGNVFEKAKIILRTDAEQR